MTEAYLQLRACERLPFLTPAWFQNATPGEVATVIEYAMVRDQQDAKRWP